MASLFPFKAVDLTHSLNAQTPHWAGGCGFEKVVVHDYQDSPGATQFRVQKISMNAGIGTHLDAPLHCFRDGKSVADLSLEQLMAPCVVVDFSQRLAADVLLTVDDIKNFEQQHGTIASGSLVIAHSGWSRYWDQPEKYRNNLHFPSVSIAAAELLCKRQIVGLGIDTLSPDLANTDFPVHRLLLGSGKYIIENVAHANKLPPLGAYAVALPMKVDDGTESAIRLIGMIKR